MFGTARSWLAAFDLEIGADPGHCFLVFSQKIMNMAIDEPFDRSCKQASAN